MWRMARVCVCARACVCGGAGMCAWCGVRVCSGSECVICVCVCIYIERECAQPQPKAAKRFPTSSSSQLKPTGGEAAIPAKANPPLITVRAPQGGNAIGGDSENSVCCWGVRRE